MKPRILSDREQPNKLTQYFDSKRYCQTCGSRLQNTGKGKYCSGCRKTIPY